jgi:hypothetical protein
VSVSITQETKDVRTLPLTQAMLDLDKRLTNAIDDMTESEKRNILQILENSIGKEKRRLCRKHQFIKTKVVSEGSPQNGIIENLSPGGAFLTTQDFFPLGSEITLSFPVLNFEFPVKLQAEVIWICPHGMGLKFKPSQQLAHRLAVQKLTDALNSSTSEY